MYDYESYLSMTHTLKYDLYLKVNKNVKKNQFQFFISNYKFI